MRIATLAAVPPAPTAGAVDTRPLPVTRTGRLALAKNGPDGHPHVSAASGIVAVGGVAWVVSDTFGELARFERLDAPGAIVPGLAPSKKKPDLESIIRVADAGGSLLVAFGSGSKDDGTRDRALLQRVDASGNGVGPASEASLRQLYAALAKRLPMGINVEGLAVRDTARGRELLLFHRGRLRGDVNVVFRLDGDAAIARLRSGAQLGADLLRGTHVVELGMLGGERLGFADARVLDDGRIAFVASAEGEDGSGDGTVMGSAVGILDANFAVQVLRPLDGPARKVEGIELTRSFDPNAGAMSFTLVTDPDTPQLAAEVLTVDLD